MSDPGPYIMFETWIPPITQEEYERLQRGRFVHELGGYAYFVCDGRMVKVKMPPESEEG